jgi:hypothetical protein
MGGFESLDFGRASCSCGQGFTYSCPVLTKKPKLASLVCLTPTTGFFSARRALPTVPRFLYVPVLPPLETLVPNPIKCHHISLKRHLIHDGPEPSTTRFRCGCSLLFRYTSCHSLRSKMWWNNDPKTSLNNIHSATLSHRRAQIPLIHLS